MIVIIDGPMITRFIDDQEALTQCADERFDVLDVVGDGVLSLDDLQPGFCGLQVLDINDDQQDLDDQSHMLENPMFKRFDVDHSNTIDRKEFRAVVREILAAMADGIGPNPVSLILAEGSLLTWAYEHELAWLDRKREDEKKAKKGEDGKVGEEKKVVKEGKIMKKKRSIKFLGPFCACGDKYYGEDR